MGLRRFAVLALLPALHGCGGPAASKTATGADAGPPTIDPCAEGTVVPTQSVSLDAWPVLPPEASADLTTDTKVASVDVPGPPVGVLIGRGGASAFAALGPPADGKLAVLARDGSRLSLRHTIPIPGAARPFGITQAASGAFLVLSVSDQVVVVDTAKAEANAADAVSFTVPTMAKQGTAVDVKLSKDDRFAFVAIEREKRIAVLDLVERRNIGSVPLDGSAITGIALSPDGTRLYASAQIADAFAKTNPSPERDQLVGSVTVVDASLATTDPRASVLGHAYVGRAPVRLALSDDGATLWVTLRGSNAVVALATEHLLSSTCTPVRAMVAVGPAPVGLTLFHAGKGLAVADSNRFATPLPPSTVSLVDVARALRGDAAALVGQAKVGVFPRELAPFGDALFVSNFDSSSLGELDVSGVPLSAP